MQHSQLDPGTMAALTAYSGISLVFFLVFLVLALVLQWRIASKAGYSGALSLLMLIPFVNFIILCLFAFTEWPIERALKATRGPSADGGTYLPPAAF